MKAYHPDDSGMTWRGNNQNSGAGGGNGGGNTMGAFMPGQLNQLANQLQMGFGGGKGAWKQDLRQPYDPSKLYQIGGGNGGGNGQNVNPGQPTPGADPRQTHNRMAMQIPQAGLLNASMQQPQQQGLLGDIPPEVLAFISGRR